MSTMIAPLENLSQMAFQMAGAVTIASLYPFDVDYVLPYQSTPGAGFLTNYRLEKSENGVPTILKVGPANEWVYYGERRYGPRPEMPDIIARNIVRNARCVPDSAGDFSCPAVWICAGSEPTQAEIRQYTAAQTRLARTRIVKCDNYHIQGNRSNITTFDRELAQWMKVDKRAHPWILEEERVDTKKCQFCQSDVDSQASVCPTCTQVIDARQFAMQSAMRKSIEIEMEKLEKEQAEFAAAQVEADRKAAMPPPMQPGTVVKPRSNG